MYNTYMFYLLNIYFNLIKHNFGAIIIIITPEILFSIYILIFIQSTINRE